MHTNLGNVNGGDMRGHLEEVGKALGAFATDLGPELNNVSVITMSEFGRRVQENGNAGLDHGHGGLMMLLGGGLVGSKVHGKWPGLAAGRWTTATWPVPTTTGTWSVRFSSGASESPTSRRSSRIITTPASASPSSTWA